MEEPILKSVEEMFRWKLEKEFLEKYQLDRIHQKSVEDYFDNMTNPKKENSLKWDKTDVLYSFTLTYYLGLKVTNEKRFDALFEAEKKNQKNQKLNSHSTKFLFKCSREPEFKSFNESKELVDFIQAYFSIGNVIPIWPGGNEARGKMGIFDIPELFFRAYPYWTDKLLELYPNACLDRVVNNELFIVCHKKEKSGYRIKGYKDTFENLNEFMKALKNDESFYMDYLTRRTKIIRDREEDLMRLLSKSKGINYGI